MRRLWAGLVALTLCISGATPAADEPGFVSLFDGKSLDGWKINENPASWSIKDGAIVCKGERSHMFYVKDEKPFKDFELRVDVLTKPKANAGIYFHTKYQDKDWPKYGFEAQVNNSYPPDPQRTGSLYSVVKVFDTYVKDDEWYTETIIVKGRNIQIKINDKTVVDYTQPLGAQPNPDYTRVIDEGTFALQCHDPGSEVHFKNIRVKRLD